MRCRRSRPTRICALKYFLGDNVQVSKLFENKYNTVGIVNHYGVIKYYVVITETRFNTIRNRVAYPDRFSNADSSYRSKIITGFPNSIEYKVRVTNPNGKKNYLFYIYELPIIHIDKHDSQQSNSILSKIIRNNTPDNSDDTDTVSNALDILSNNKDLINQFMHRIEKIFKDIIADAYNRGYESGYNDGILTSS